AGADTTFTLCSTNSTTNLCLVLVGAQAGGTWTGPGGVFFDGTYEPTLDPEGDYLYTVIGNAPCASDQAVVSVMEITAPYAGRDSTITLCADGPAVGLFIYLDGAQAGGSWQGGFSGTYTPGTTAPGTFTYVLPGVVPCIGDQASVTVIDAPAPNAGTDGNLTVCDQGAATSLLAALGGSPDAGGAWSGPSAVVNDQYDPATMDPGDYTYTVTGTAPCGSATATVTVS